MSGGGEDSDSEMSGGGEDSDSQFWDLLESLGLPRGWGLVKNIDQHLGFSMGNNLGNPTTYIIHFHVENVLLCEIDNSNSQMPVSNMKV